MNTIWLLFGCLFVLFGETKGKDYIKEESDKHQTRKSHKYPREIRAKESSLSAIFNELLTYVEEPKPYAFKYDVQDSYTGTNFGHYEVSDGEEVSGYYSVSLPDGRVQRVTYSADEENGFTAKVTYEENGVYEKFIRPNQEFQFARLIPVKRPYYPNGQIRQSMPFSYFWGT